MPVRVVTLGELRVFKGDVELTTLPGQRVRCALLVHLAVDGSVTRDRLLGLLWPDKAPDKARHSLSQTVYELKKELGEGWVAVEGETLRIADSVSTDVGEFEEAVNGGDDERAVELYRGGFLDGANLSTSRAYEGWVDRTRARMARNHKKAAARLVATREAAGDVMGALAVARAWVEGDPLDDEAQHELIALLARAGRRSEALRQYDRYAELLARELEVDPLEQTRDLVAAIRADGAGSAGGTVEERPGPAVSDEMSADSPPTSETPALASAGADAPGGAAGTMLESFIALADELRRRRVNRVAVAYVVVAFAFLEGADLLLGPLGAPAWIQQALAVLVVVGFPAVLAVAWVFDITPRGLEVTRSEDSPGTALAAVVARRGLAAVVVVSLVGLVGIWSWQRVQTTPVFDVNRVMVFPLVASGPTPALKASIGEDVATMIGHALDRTGPLRWIDGWTLLEPLERNDISELTDDEARALAVSRQCAYYVTGRVVAQGDQATVVLSLWDTERNEEVAAGSAAGLANATWQTGLQAVTELLPTIVGTDVANFGQEIQSRSPAAVASFLLGEQAFRRGRAEVAMAHYEASVAEDTLFSLAAFRGAQAGSWSHQYDEARELVDVALALELREAERHFAVGMRAHIDGLGDSAAAAVDRAIALDSTNALAWALKGEVHYHLAPRTPQPDSVAIHALNQAREIDPGGVNVTLHLLEHSLAVGDHASWEPLMAEFSRAEPEEHLLVKMELMESCSRGSMTDVEWREAAVNHRRETINAAASFARGGSNPTCAESGFRAVLSAVSGPTNGDREAALVGLQAILLQQGRESEAVAILDAATRSPTDAQTVLSDGLDATGSGDSDAASAPSFVIRPDAPSTPSPLDERAQSLMLLWSVLGFDLGERPALVADAIKERWGDDYSGAPRWNVGLWRVALYHLSVNNLEEAGRVLGAMDLRAESGDATAALFAQTARAHEALAMGDTATALERFSALRTTGPRAFLTWTIPEPLGMERLLEARLLLARGTADDTKAAYDLASTLDGFPLGYTPFLASSIEVRIEAAELLGLDSQAQRLRRRLAALRGLAPAEA